MRWENKQKGRKDFDSHNCLDSMKRKVKRKQSEIEDLKKRAEELELKNENKAKTSK